MKFRLFSISILIILLLNTFNDVAFSAQENLKQEEIQVTAVIEGLFESKLNHLKGLEISFYEFFTNKTNRDAIYFSDRQVFTKELYKREGIDIDSMNIVLVYSDIKINNLSASIEFYENFNYIYNNGNGIPSGFGTIYNAYLKKLKDGTWRIEKIISNDEFDHEYYDKGFSLQKVLDQLYLPVYRNELEDKKSSMILEKKISQIESISSLPFTSYNTSSAASYAKSYAITYNNKFKSYSSDCQNFASQCVWYGFGGSNTITDINNGAWPMTSTWYQKGPNNDSSITWINVDSFAEMIENSSPSVSGPYGALTSGVSYAKVGDVLQYYDSNPDDYVHSYIVSSVTGTNGGRTFGDIYVCSHTTNRNNVKLSTIWTNPNSTSKFRTINILGYYN